MPRRVNLAMLLGLIVVSVLSFGLTAGAQEGEGPPDEAAQAQETLEQMRIDLEMAGNEYNAAASTLQGLNGDITGTTQELEAAELRLAEAEARLSSRAGEVYKLGQLAFVDYILDSRSASDFANRMDLLARLLIGEQEEVAQLRAARDELEEEAETRRQQVQNYEQTTAEMEARWDKASALEAEMEDYLASLNEPVLAEIEAEREDQAQDAAEEAASMLLAAQEMEAQRAAEEAQRAAEEAQQAAKADAARQAAAAEKALEAAEAAETEQERQQAQAEAQQAEDAAEEARAAAEEAARQAADEQAKKQAAADEQAKKQAAADEQAKKQAAADEQAALRAEQMEAQRDAEAEAAKNAIAAEKALRALEAAETEQERQQAQAKAQQAEDAAREQARKAAEAKKSKQDAEKALAEEQQKAQSAGTQPTTPILGATGTQPTPNADGQPVPNQSAGPNADGQPAPNQSAGPPVTSGSAGAEPVAEGRKAQGVPYVLGGEDLNGMDCTGFVLWAYRGIMALPHSIEGQAASGPQVSGEPQPGDILIWPGYHVAMATGNGMMIHASNYHMQVIEVPITDMEPYAYAVRPAR